MLKLLKKYEEEENREYKKGSLFLNNDLIDFTLKF